MLLPCKLPLIYEHYGHISYFHKQRTVYKGDWKYTETENHIDQLYNLKNDPYELSNLAENCADIRNEMKIELSKLQKKYKDIN